MGAAARFPVVLPKDRAIPRIDTPRVIGRRHVKNAVDHENAAAKPRAAAAIEFARSQSAHNDRIWSRCATARWGRNISGGTGSGGEACYPCEAQIPHVRLIDLLE